MPAASPIRCTSSCAAAALETSSATISLSRISSDAGARVSGKWVAIAPQYIPFCLLSAVALIQGNGGRLDQVNADPLHAIAEAEHAGGAVAQVHDAVANVRAAIINADDDP